MSKAEKIVDIKVTIDNEPHGTNTLVRYEGRLSFGDVYYSVRDLCETDEEYTQFEQSLIEVSEGNCTGGGFQWDGRHVQFIKKPLEETPLPSDLGITFTSVIRAWLSEEELFSVRKLNREESDRSICHTHDYCDANMAMLKAFSNHGVTFNPNNEDHIRLWNSAWNYAKAYDFNLEFKS